MEQAMTCTQTKQQLHENKGYISELMRTLLRLPAFYKILIANSIIILFWGGAGLWVLKTYFRMLPWGVPAIILVSGAIILSILINSVLIRLALTPLADLSNTMVLVSKGNFNLRANFHPLGGKVVDECISSLNNMLDTLQQTLKTLEDERELSRLRAIQVISAQEEERKRIARELHDETSQVLASLVIGLEQLHNRAPDSMGGCSEIKSEILRLKSLTDKSLEELHRLIFNLRPSILDDMGLRSALSWLLREQVEKHNVRVDFIFTGSDSSLPDEIEIVLFRIAQEALTNIIKYAKASEVKVNVNINTANVELEISDNGIGFDPTVTARDKDRRLGIFGMQERAALFSGKFTIQSFTGKGTTIHVLIPILLTPVTASSQGVSKHD